MASRIRESLDELRSQLSICKCSSSSLLRGYAKGIVEDEWKNVQLYRSDKLIPVLRVTDLHEQTMHFRDYEELNDILENVYFEEGVKFTVEVVMMTGRQFGRLPEHDDY